MLFLNILQTTETSPAAIEYFRRSTVMELSSESKTQTPGFSPSLHLFLKHSTKHKQSLLINNLIMPWAHFNPGHTASHFEMKIPCYGGGFRDLRSQEKIITPAFLIIHPPSQ